MKLISHSFEANGWLPQRLAFGRVGADQPMEFSDNRNPHLAWHDLPANTRSLALICHDPDAPTVMDDANQPQRSIDFNQPRRVFYHWLLLNIDPALGELAEGAFADGVITGGKTGPQGPQGTWQGLNGYSQSQKTQSNSELKGDYYGYDGPCPPWNDERVHRYIFTLYALSIDCLTSQDQATAADLLPMIQAHCLQQTTLMGKYALNPNARDVS